MACQGAGKRFPVLFSSAVLLSVPGRLAANWCRPCSRRAKLSLHLTAWATQTSRACKKGKWAAWLLLLNIWGPSGAVGCSGSQLLLVTSRSRQFSCEAHLLDLVQQWPQQVGPVHSLRERGLEQELVLAAECLKVQSRLLQSWCHVSTAALAAMGAPCSPPSTRRAGLNGVGRQQWSWSCQHVWPLCPLKHHSWTGMRLFNRTQSDGCSLLPHGTCQQQMTETALGSSRNWSRCK